MEVPSPGDVTRLLVAWNEGNQAAVDQLKAPKAWLFRELNREPARDDPSHPTVP